MATLTKPNTFSAGATIFASEHNENFDTLYNDYNGNITNANIATGAAIAQTKVNFTDALITAGDIIMRNTTCPSGFTRLLALDGKFLTGGATYNAAKGGSDTVDISHAHTGPSHAHLAPYTGWSVTSGTAGGQTLSCGKAEVESITTADQATASSGTGNTSTAGNASHDNRPAYAEIVLCLRD